MNRAGQGANEKGITTFEETILYISAIVIPVLAIPGVTYEFMTQKYAVFTLLMTLLFGILALRGMRRDGYKLYITLPHVFLGLFALAAFLSAINVARENPYYLRYTLDMAFYVLYVFIMALYISNRVIAKAVINRFLFIVLSGGMFVAVDALLNFYTGYDIWLGRIGRAFLKTNMKSTIGNPNFVADFLGTLMPLALYFMLSYDYGLEFDREKKEKIYKKIFIMKLISTVYYVTFTAVVLLATNRSTYISLISAFVIFGISLLLWKLKGASRAVDREKLTKLDPKLSERLKKLNRIFLIVAILASIVFVWIYSTENPLNPGAVSAPQRIKSIVTDVSSREGRLLSWMSSVYQWRKHKIFGTGIGTYQIYTITYLGDVQRDIPQWMHAWNNFKRTHNDYLQVLGETGLVGFLSIIGLVVSMAIFFFRNILKLQDSDDVLLFITIASGFIVLVLHSATSFPVHLMPNGMIALFLGAVGVGKYFNKDGFFSRKCEIRGLIYKLCLVGVMVVAIMSTFLRWNFFLGEVMFRWGNVYYQKITAYEKALRDLEAKEREFLALKQDLENHTGRFEYLDPARYLALKMPEYKKAYPRASEETLILQIGKAREEEEEKYRRQILDALEKIKNAQKVYAERRDSYYFKAREYLMASLDYNPTYGKAMFYLGILCSREQRTLEFLDRLSRAESDEEKLAVLREAFVEGEPMTKFVPEVYRGNESLGPWKHPQKGLSPAIPLMEAQIRDWPLKKVYMVIEQASKQGLKLDDVNAVLNFSELYTFQQVQDNVDYFEGSFMCFNEKNSYRVLGRHYVNLILLCNKTISRLQKLKLSYPVLGDVIDDALKELLSYRSKYYQAYKHWYDKAIYVIPDTWNRFKDWENIYEEYLRSLIRFERMNPETYSKIKEILSRELWACKYEIMKRRWGIPDKTFEVMKALIQNFINKKMYQEALTLINDVYELYEPVYQWNKELVEQGKIPSRLEERAKKFVENFENFAQIRSKFIQDVARVYNNVIILKDKSATELYEKDWSENILTGEKASLTMPEILDRVRELLKREREGK